MIEPMSVPPAYTFAWTVVQALRDLNGSGTIEEINERCVMIRGLTEEQQSVPGPKRGATEVHHRLGWARTLAKALGLITSSGRGVWALTEAGRTVTAAEVDDLRRARSRARAANRKATAAAGAEVVNAALVDDDMLDQDSSPDGDDSAELDERNWKEQLLAGTVGASKVRDFRGAMVGHGDKVLLITTGTFTADARAEATRDGAPPIDLVDGDQLAELLREFELGVTTKQRVVHEHAIDPGFFTAM